MYYLLLLLISMQFEENPQRIIKYKDLFQEPEKSYKLAIAHFQLGDLKRAKSFIKNILNPIDFTPLPERYIEVCKSIEQEIEVRENSKLGRTSSLMEGSLNRLKFGDLGKQTQDIQKRIIENLDEMIQEVESQLGQDSSSSSSPEKSQQPKSMETPSIDSSIMQDSGPGKTDKKSPNKDGKNWGNMPEKEKIKALETMKRNYPPHFAEAIENFTKKLAEKPPQN